MRRTTVRLATTVIGILGVVATGVLTVDATSYAEPDPIEIVGQPKEYSCTSGEYTGRIKFLFAKGPENSNEDRIGRVQFSMHAPRRPFSSWVGRNGRVWFKDDAARPLQIAMNVSGAGQDSGDHTLVGSYNRIRGGGFVRIRFQFDTGELVSIHQCTVMISNLHSSRNSSGLDFLTFTCEEAEFSGTIYVSTEGISGNLVREIGYKIDVDGKGYGGKRAYVRVDDKAPNTVPLFETKLARQDSKYNPFADSSIYVRPAPGQVDIRFKFTRGAKSVPRRALQDPIGTGTDRFHPECQMTVPDFI